MPQQHPAGPYPQVSDQHSVLDCACGHTWGADQWSSTASRRLSSAGQPGGCSVLTGCRVGCAERACCSVAGVC